MRFLTKAVDIIIGTADTMSLKKNVSKTKYMLSARQSTQFLTLGSVKFEVFKKFIYFGTQINADIITDIIILFITFAPICSLGQQYI